MIDQRHERGASMYFSGKQFMALLGSILSIQIGVNWWAARTWVHEVAIEVVKQHNIDPEAHVRALIAAQQERMEQTRQIIVLQTKIDGIENMIRTLAGQGVFDHANGTNGRR